MIKKRLHRGYAYSHSLHISLLGSVIYRVSVCYYCTPKTQEFRTKDFLVRSIHSIEHQECKYCLGKTSILWLNPLYDKRAQTVASSLAV